VTMDGISPGTTSGSTRYRISIFLSVFNVHVNRSPVAGVIRDVRYQRGKFLNAMGGNSARRTSRTLLPWKATACRSIQADRRFDRAPHRFQFQGWRPRSPGPACGTDQVWLAVDVLVDPDAAIQVKLGDRVRGGATVLAVLPVAKPVKQPVPAGAAVEREAH